MALFQTLTDNWTTLDATKWDFWGGANLSINAGRLQIQNNAAASAYWGMRSIASYELTGSYAMVQLVQAPTIAAIDPTLAFGFLTLEIDSNNRYFWELAPNGIINGFSVNASNYNNFVSFTYNAAIHKYFRIREAAGTVYFGWSTTGYDGWTEFATPVATAITALYWAAAVGNWGDPASAQYTLLMDNFNIVPTPPPPTTINRGNMLLAF